MGILWIICRALPEYSGVGKRISALRSWWRTGAFSTPLTWTDISALRRIAWRLRVLLYVMITTQIGNRDAKIGPIRESHDRVAEHKKGWQTKCDGHGVPAWIHVRCLIRTCPEGVWGTNRRIWWIGRQTNGISRPDIKWLERAKTSQAVKSRTNTAKPLPDDLAMICLICFMKKVGSKLVQIDVLMRWKGDQRVRQDGPHEVHMMNSVLRLPVEVHALLGVEYRQKLVMFFSFGRSTWAPCMTRLAT